MKLSLRLRNRFLLLLLLIVAGSFGPQAKANSYAVDAWRNVWQAMYFAKYAMNLLSYQGNYVAANDVYSAVYYELNLVGQGAGPGGTVQPGLPGGFINTYYQDLGNSLYYTNY